MKRLIFLNLFLIALFYQYAYSDLTENQATTKTWTVEFWEYSKNLDGRLRRSQTIERLTSPHYFGPLMNSDG